MEGVIQLVPLTNRRMKNGFKKELAKVQHLIVEIESEFEFSIFNAPKTLSYEELYKFFLNKWHEVVDGFVAQYNYTYLAFDRYHFARKYKSRI
jgi:hypothetical protein